MPQSMPGNSMRGYLIDKIEQYINTDPAASWNAIMDDLKVQGTHLVTLLTKDYGTGAGILDPTDPIDVAYIRHLQADWFGLMGTPVNKWRGRYWRGSTRRGGYQPIDPVVRTGLWAALALRRAMTTDTAPYPPLRMIWLCAGSHFELHTYPNANQITTLILTPAEGKMLDAEGLHESAGDITPQPEPIWVSRHTLTGANAAQRAGYAAVTTDVGGFPVPGLAAATIYRPWRPAHPI